MGDVILIGAVGVCTIIALTNPTFGVLVFVCLGFLNPHSMTWGLGRTLRLSMFVAIATIVGYVFSSEPKRLPMHRETVILLGLWAVFASSTLFAFERALPHLILMSKIFLMILVSSMLINTQQKLQQLIRVIALSLGFYGAKGGIFFFATGGHELVFGPADSFLAANNSIGLALAMNVPLLVYLRKTETNPWLRQTVTAMLVLSYPTTLGTYSRGAWMGLAVVTALLTLKSKYRFTVIPAIGILVLVALPFVGQLIPQRAVDRYDLLVNFEEDSSAQSRFWNWEFCQRVAMANPVLGAGFDFYGVDAYATYFPEFLERWPGKVWSCHSSWLTVLSEHGVLGFALWISLLVACFLSLRGIRRARQANSSEASQRALLATAVQASLIAFLIVGTFIDAAYFDMLYYLVAVIVILKEIIRHAPEDLQPTPAPERRPSVP